MTAGQDLPSPESRIAIVGTRGVPARYGGFETLAEQLAKNISAEHVELTIYGQRSAFTPSERQGRFHGHRRAWMPFLAKGSQSLLHDALQLFHAVFVGRHNHILLLGTSAAWVLPLVRLFGRRLRIVTNIDGLEWRRDKFGAVPRMLLRALESLAVRYSNAVIADNAALVPIVEEIHGLSPVMIAYGGDQAELPGEVGWDRNGYLLSIARIEPENNTAMILAGARAAAARILFIGNWNASDYGRDLLEEYADVPGCEQHSPVYDQAILAGLRSGSAVYVHGHSVGGTNPSLVEAIFHAERILAFDCAFNRATLEGEGEYFSCVEELEELIKSPNSGRIAPDAQQRLRQRYRWPIIAKAYLDLVLE